MLFASGLGNIGTDHLMDFVVDFFPTAAEHAAVHAEPASAGNGHGIDLKSATLRRLSIYVFKTANDPFAGRITYFKVFSGVVKNDATLQNFTRSTSEKLAHLSIPQGKNLVPVPELHAGRHRRSGKTARHAYRRHAGRQGQSHSFCRRHAARAGDHVCHRAEVAQR